jgi:hypothetical protein
MQKLGKRNSGKQSSDDMEYFFSMVGDRKEKIKFIIT